MKKKILVGSLILISNVIAGCAVGPIQAERADLDPKVPEASVLFAYEIKTTEPTIRDSGCKFVLKHVESHQDYYIPLEYGSHYAHFNLPAGHYWPEGMECANFIYEMKRETFADLNFSVHSDRINVLGGYVVDFKTRHKVSLFRMNTEVWKQALGEAMAAFTPSARARTVSAWNGRRLPQGDVALAFDKGIEVKYDPSVDHSEDWVKSFQSKVKTCSEREDENNPFHFGRSKWSVDNSSDGAPLIKRIDESTYSDFYFNCVETALREFYNTPLMSKKGSTFELET